MRAVIAAGGTDLAACRAAKVSARRLYAAREAELADLPRNRRGPPVGVRRRLSEWLDIPQEEIYRRARELRETWWTEEERARRFNPRFSAMLG